MMSRKNNNNKDRGQSMADLKVANSIIFDKYSI